MRRRPPLWPARRWRLANGGLPIVPDHDDGPLYEIRRSAAADLASAGVILARASSRMGAHADALPALEAAHAERPDDESLLADLLRSEAVVRGPAAALERFERYRREVRERLGANPGEQLQRTHQHLLALDQPVRSGVRYDASTLIGRERDLERLRALMAGSRVVSIVGPGGIGKTRLAHVLARDSADARSCTWSSWWASPRPRTWSGRSDRRSASATRSAAVAS